MLLVDNSIIVVSYLSMPRWYDSFAIFVLIR
jgi:hypothetical protein